MSYPPIDLAHAVVLVTGGGRATGSAFAARGAVVCLADLDLSVAQDAATEIGAHAFGVDVTTRASFAQCVVAVPGMAVYNASKFAALGLSLAVREEFADSGVSVSAVLPSAVRTGLVSGVRLGHGMPTVDSEDVARAIVASVRSRRAEIPVPGYLRLFDAIDALVPDPILRLARRLLDDTRALTCVDAEARREYEQRVADQATVRAIRKAEADRP